MTTPDPDPADTTGLEPGGGVPPGETPPGEGAISGLSHSEAPPGRTITPLALIAIVILVLLVAGFLLAAAIVSS
jgi:Family of unknown function (DUF6480)